MDAGPGERKGEGSTINGGFELIDVVALPLQPSAQRWRLAGIAQRKLDLFQASREQRRHRHRERARSFKRVLQQGAPARP